MSISNSHLYFYDIEDDTKSLGHNSTWSLKIPSPLQFRDGMNITAF
jgi:hypothetical protein